MRVFVELGHPQSRISRKKVIMKRWASCHRGFAQGAGWNDSELGSHRFISRIVARKTK